MRIFTQNIRPPIPTRGHDWTAVFESYDEGDPQGFGETEEAAIKDLLEQTKEG